MRIARLYGLGREEVTGPEEDRKQDYVIDDPAKQRLAAEEYIAYLAQKEVKPSWWREMLQKIRMALAKLPLFRDVTMTDRQIELLLARAGRKMRSRNNRAAVDVMWGGNKALNVGDEEGVRFSLYEFEDKVRFVDVEADQSLFDGLSPKEAGEMAEKIIREKFVGKVLGIDNPVFVNASGAGEYRFPAKPLTDKDIQNAKMKASPELDNLIDAGKPLPDKPDGEKDILTLAQ